MPQSVARDFVISAKEICVENILPGPPTHGPGFDLAQADVAQGKNAQRFEQRSRQILQAEGDRGLIGAANHTATSADQKESGEVPLVIFNPSLKNSAVVRGGSLP